MPKEWQGNTNGLHMQNVEMHGLPLDPGLYILESPQDLQLEYILSIV